MWLASRTASEDALSSAGDDDDAVDAAAHQRLDDGALAGRRALGRGGDELVLPDARLALDGRADLRVEGVGEVLDDEGDGEGPALAHEAGAVVATEAEPLDDGADPLGRVGTHAGLVVDHARDGLDRDVGLGGDVGHGRAGGCPVVRQRCHARSLTSERPGGNVSGCRCRPRTRSVRFDVLTGQDRFGLLTPFVRYGEVSQGRKRLGVAGADSLSTSQDSGSTTSTEEPMAMRSGIHRGVIALAVLATATAGAVAGPAQRTPSAALPRRRSRHPPPPRARVTSRPRSRPARRSRRSRPSRSGPAGPRQQNVSGTASANGSLLGSVVGVTASAENTPGEVAANLADANPRQQVAGLRLERLGALPARHAGEGRALLADLGQRLARAGPQGLHAPGVDRRHDVDRPRPPRPASTSRAASPRARSTSRRRGRTRTTGSTSPRSTPAASLQLADWDLSDGSTGLRPGHADEADRRLGPIRGFNIKPLVGWTGVKALRYSGGHTADGRGYAWNRLFDVDLPVGARTRLRYKIFPDMIAGDLEYPSTYAALDVHFTDGTYLSDLGADDQHGVAASPSGQGKGKILYANQWNAVALDVGKVAAGKTIDRVLVGYDNTGGATKDTRFGAGSTTSRCRRTRRSIDGADLTNYVDMRRGTNASGGFSRGNNLPISAVPNGFTFFTPVTNATSQSWEYYYQPDNNDGEPPVLQGLAVSPRAEPVDG